MTLHEHAKQIYDRVANKLPGAVVDELTPYSGKCWLEAAYDELHTELKELQDLKATVDQAAETIANLKLPKIKPEPPDPDLERIKRERGEARAALNRIHTASSEGPYGTFDPAAIAERAVKIIKEWREKRPEPPKKAVYEWRPITPISDYLFRNQDYVGSVCLYGGGPRRSWDAAGSPSWVRGSSASSDLAKAAVEAVVRAHYGDEA